MIRSSPLALLLLTCFLQGCSIEPASPPTLDQWRRGLERYVWDQGNGDPAVLRDATWDNLHPGFALLGDPLPDRSTDILGLLVAHPHVANHAYFIFLVATVQNDTLADLRPIALDIDAGNFYWQESPPDDTQTLLYRRSHAPTSPAQGPRFPAPDDTFDVQSTEAGFTITHRQSGATWTVHLPTTSQN